MGAGKTSIAKLIDYCLGGGIELSPAMQSEFINAKLSLSLKRSILTIERDRDSDQVIASWDIDQEKFQSLLPARKSAGELIPGTGVEVLSDLIFWLSGLEPPRVRRSKLKDESERGRLSIRDLFWYCYLDQDEIDSSFFHLNEGADTWKRLKSRDVLRYVIGFHDEKIAEIEATLDRLRGERQSLSATIESLSRALKEIGVDSQIQIAAQISELRAKAESIAQQIEIIRKESGESQPDHAADNLRREAIVLGDEIASLDEEIRETIISQQKDTRHLHELETLTVKYRRSVSARAVLGGVNFEFCPKCAQKLPHREEFDCVVCGQPEQIDIDDKNTEIIKQDMHARIAELNHILERQSRHITDVRQKRDALTHAKFRIERQRNEASKEYDSAFLSTVLAKERERAALLQEIENRTEMLRLPQLLTTLHERIGEIQGRESLLRADLRDAREKAESDATNLDRLKVYFLECLVLAQVPGITLNDRVEIPTTTFYPAIFGPRASDTTLTSFDTLSSGGKKTLFKCCFAIAIHRLAAQLRAPLPELLIMDSPMKNISERENRDAFQGFYQMIYDLKAGELAGTQIILIDKEYSAPVDKHEFTLLERHMRPDDFDNPPLIPYYKGK